jgi:hypothetical protein
LSSATNKITQQPPSVPAIVFVFSSHASFYSRRQQQQEGNSATLKTQQPQKTLEAKLINLATSSAISALWSHISHVTESPRKQTLPCHLSCHVSFHVILHCHVIWSEILLTVEYHYSWYIYALVNQDLALILFFMLAHK